LNFTQEHFNSTVLYNDIIQGSH